MDRRTLVCLLLAGAAPLTAQRSASVIRTDSLRANLFALAADSMGGRQTGSLGDWKAQEWVAAEFRAAGLEPAGESGGYFQVIPFLHIYVDTAAALSASAFFVTGLVFSDRAAAAVTAVAAGTIGGLWFVLPLARKLRE